MFSQKHYFPILRWRPAELGALCKLIAEDVKNIAPLFELCQCVLSVKDKQLATTNTEDFLYEIVRRIAESWDRPYLIDLGDIENIGLLNGKKHVVDFYFELLRKPGLKAIPVTGLTRSDAFNGAIARVAKIDRSGVCIRLTETNLRDASLTAKLQILLRRLDLTPTEIDVMVDLRIVSPITMRLDEICRRLPYLLNWRTFIVSGGAFPENLTNLEKNAEHELVRNDWKIWIDAIKRNPQLSRIPSYSDYTIQHPDPPEPLNYVPNPSASIRYAAQEHWVIMRGEGVKNDDGPGYAQYWAQASLLTERKEYNGENFSYGDQYIAQMGGQTSRTGTPKTWLEAGINHHITLTSRQIVEHFESLADSRSERGIRRFEIPLPNVWNSRRLVLPLDYRQGYLFPPVG